MSSVCWQIPNVYIPVQSSVPNSRLIYLILLNISTCMFIAFSNFAYPKLNSCIELLLPQQTATSSSWAENSKSFFYSFFSHIPHPICLQSPVSSAFRIQMECDPISPTPPQLLPPSWPLTPVLDYQSLPTGPLALVSYSLFQSSGQTNPFKTQVISCCFNASISLGVKAQVLPIATGSKGYPAPIPISPTISHRHAGFLEVPLPPQGLWDCSFIRPNTISPSIATWLHPQFLPIFFSVCP